MSTTTRSTRTRSSRQESNFQIPSDYIIRSTGTEDNSPHLPGPHLPVVASGSEESENRIYPYPALHPRAAGAGPVSWWPSNWRRIPEYSPVNYELDRSERPIGENRIFSALLFMTLGGCGLISTYAGIWRNTFGRLNDRIFRYKTGGEF